ncbi:MAG: 30S ribosomal protein S12 methylthiotransferase RimO [Treponema sp.]|jgi:ribosomal protein S12 methylthiotransferase|nr:30S ribosomal protein S12 methylthiotransferase RimO [Treponema sp.]
MKYYLDPFGCVKNQVDAENMMAHLNKEGWESVSDGEQADLIIVNSCGFIESAKQESINAVLEWRKLYPEKKILLAGCLAQRYEKELRETLTEADGFMGIENPPQITDAVSKVMNSAQSEKVKKTKTADKTILETGERPLLSLPGSAYIKISEGCNNRCSYCAIPLIRGGLASRTIPDIVEECRALLSRGIKELCIIGQDIGAFGTDAGSAKLPQLLNAISALKGHFWVRLLYIHPDHFPLQILDVMERDNRFLPYFDIPFQHASSKILTAMNRHGSAENYLALLKTIRARLQHAVIRSTFLLGFPGETEEDFSALLDFQQKAGLDWLGCFAYSREENTSAYSMKNRVSAKTASERKRIIEERQIPITEKNMEYFVGQTLDILIEERITGGGEDGENFLLGRLYCHAPEIDGTAVIAGSAEEKNPQLGEFVKCKVIAGRGIDLEVRLVG